MSRFQKSLIILFSLVALLCISWLFSQATHTKTPSPNIPDDQDYISINTLERVDVTSPFDVRIDLDTHQKTVNTIGLYLEFDPRHLKVLQMETADSFCEFYPENKFDNQQGKIRLSCGAPSPGFSGTNKLLKLQLEPLTVGNTVLKVLPESMVLLNDGKGTNVLNNFPSKEITVLNTF